MALRERKKAVLRDAILRNAMKLFAERGYDSVSLDDIVAASMCSRSTFHRYFGSKEDLLFPTADERLRTLQARLSAAKKAEDPWAILRREVSAGLCGFLDDFDADLREQSLALWFNEPTPRRRYLEIVLEWEHVILEFLEKRSAPSASRVLELQLLAASITSALRAALNAAMTTGADVRALIDRAFDLIEFGRQRQFADIAHKVELITTFEERCMEFDLGQLESYIPAEDRLLWNQSFYFNAYDPRTKIGCVIRAGFQEGLGTANSWVVFFIDGKPLFQRFNANLPCPRERLAEGVTVGGLTLESVEPLRAARVRFSARDFSFDLAWRAMHPLMDAIAFGHGKTDSFASSLAGAHLEGSCFVEGRITSRDGAAFDFNGTGARDIAAGVRDWDGMEHYRVAWPIFEDNTAIIGIRGISKGRDSYMSMLHDGEKWTRITETRDEMTFERDSMTVAETAWSFVDERGRAWRIAGRPLFRCFLPADTYVLAEHIAEFTRSDGAIGYGLIECGFSLPWPKATA